ncbi:hypothetical protein G9A89_006866 [Geosiphon pyriformis]|nr:hypothetical protein G9A89_006866 [Geosiphon pyriformis]
MSTFNARTPLARVLFQNKQEKTKLLGTYGAYFEGFNSHPNMPSECRLPLSQPNFRTPIVQAQQNLNNPNPASIIQQNLPPEIAINPVPVAPIVVQQLLQPPHQQQPIIAPMAYALITKLEKFTGKEDNAQAWINNVAKAITANNWDDAKALQAIPYFLQDTADS